MPCRRTGPFRELPEPAWIALPVAMTVTDGDRYRSAGTTHGTYIAVLHVHIMLVPARPSQERVRPVSAGDWIAVIGACVATLAFFVSGRALRLQRSGADAGTRTQFDELVRQLWVALSKSYEDVGRPQPGAGVTPPDVAAALGEIQTLALRAHDFLYPDAAGDMTAVGWRRRVLQLWNPPSEPLQLNWYDAIVLASSFAQVWDYQRAKRYWELAVNPTPGI
jgi:hypothetical protein